MADGPLVLVCGSRSWQNSALIRRVLIQYVPENATLLHGGAEGADKIAASTWGTLLHRPCIEVKPDWKLHGKKAGILRNLAMLDMKPNQVVAFWDGRSPGTKHVLKEARRRKIPIKALTFGDVVLADVFTEDP